MDHLRQAATNGGGEVSAALQLTVRALASAGLPSSFQGHPRQDLCHEVLPQLLLGGWAALGRDCSELRRRQVTHVVSIISTEQRQLPEFIVDHLHVHSFDSEDAAARWGLFGGHLRP